uniref:DNA polymerase kappa n=1 Tax=Tetradesmus obliquus TaxID=3088 RepID=A0A383WPR7_TETOB|eukprot:jgi/Sobl393_1/10124/SZX79460.1
MAEDQAAGAAAAGLAGQAPPGHADAQAVHVRPLDAHVAVQPSKAAAAASQQPSWQQYNSVFTASKAGMQNVDKEKVKRIVYEMSKDSAHFKNEQRKQAQVDVRIAQLKARAASLSQAELAAHQKAADAKLAQLEAGRDLSRTWLHADMDAFYASVEELDRPDLASKPMAVGGMGMITTANYEARKFGVRSAMPGFIARKLCPQLVFVKPDFRKYEAASAATREVFKLYDPHFVAGSLDEAYLDVTDYCAAHSMTGEQVAAALRAGVEAATRLTCSVGVAPNATLAKVASDLNKPNGQALVGSSREAVMAFVQDLPIRKVPGIGKVSEQTLNALGITSCGHLLQQRALISALFSSISSHFFLSAGLGLGATQHGSSRGDEGGAGAGGGVSRKGISCERTFANMSSPAEMEKMAETLVHHLAADMESEGIAAKTLTLKLKTTDFAVRTRGVTLPGHVHTPQQMLPPVLKLLRAELPCEIRLMGVRGSALRRVVTAGDALDAAAAGGRLNALQRMILQGRRQQQQQQQQQGEAADQQDSGGQQQQQQDGGQCAAAGEESGQLAQHMEEHRAAAAALSYDVLDLLDDDDEDDAEGFEHSGAGCSHAGWGDEGATASGASDEVGAAAAAAAAAGTAPMGRVAGAVAAGQQMEGHQELPQEQQQWQHWQQECVHGDQLVAQLAALHQQQQQQQQQLQGAQSSPAVKRAKLNCPQHSFAEGCQQQQQQQQALGMLALPHRQQQQQQPQQLPPTWGAAGDPAADQPAKLQEQQQQQGGPPLPRSQWCKASQLPNLDQQWQQQQQQRPLQGQQAQQMQQQQPHDQLPTCMPYGIDGVQQQQQQQLHSRHGLEAGSHAGMHAAAAAATSTQQHGKGGRSSRGTSSSSSTWACLACTFSGNKQVMLRCELCGTPKGSNTPPAPGWLSGDAANTAAAAAHSKPGGQQAGRRGQGRSSSRASGKQLTLEQVVLPPR